MTIFEGLTTVAEIDKRFKSEFYAQDCMNNIQAYWSLSEQHRKAHEALSAAGIRIAYDPDPNRISPLQMRNWAKKQGISLPRKGRVPLNVENAYRREHSLPIIKEEKPAKVQVDATPAEIRAWAREEGLEFAVKGRVHPDIVRAYAAAHRVEDLDVPISD